MNIFVLQLEFNPLRLLEARQGSRPVHLFFNYRSIVWLRSLSLNFAVCSGRFRTEDAKDDCVRSYLDFSTCFRQVPSPNQLRGFFSIFQPFSDRLIWEIFLKNALVQTAASTLKLAWDPGQTALCTSWLVLYVADCFKCTTVDWLCWKHMPVLCTKVMNIHPLHTLDCATNANVGA